MKESEKIRIKELREEGIGYKKIANVLRINVNTVKSFCRNNKLMTEELNDRDICKYCKKPIIQVEHRKKKIFCSKECKTKWFNINRAKTGSEKIICKNCGKSFNAYIYEHRKYCCHSCYIKSRFKGGDGNE